jgi:hypothetical protein
MGKGEGKEERRNRGVRRAGDGNGKKKRGNEEDRGRFLTLRSSSLIAQRMASSPSLPEIPAHWRIHEQTRLAGT